MVKKCMGLLVAVLVFAGCASVPESTLYVLDMESSRTTDALCVYVDVQLRSSNTVARPEIMIKPSATRLEYYALHKWAGDLGSLVSEKIQAELGQNKHSPYTAALSGTILAFEQVDTATGADVHIKLDVELQAGKVKRAFAHRQYEVRLAAESSSPEAVVEALSLGMEQISGQIEQDLVVLTKQAEL